MPQRHLHLDYESFSKAAIDDVGAYRYSFDPSTEILCAAMALGDEEPAIWHAGLTSTELDKLAPYWDALEDPETLIYAFNAQMEISMSLALMESTWGIKPPALTRFRCCQSIARRAALPASLSKLGEVLNLATQKDKRGKALIKKFCVMQKEKKATKKNAAVPVHRIYPQDDPAAFQEMLDYCKTDVVVEREATKLLSYFDDPLNNRNYTLHETINARGVSVNLDALHHAQKLIDEESDLVGAKFRELVGFEYTQNKVLLDWLHQQNCHLDNLQAATVDGFLEKFEDLLDDEVDIVVQALRMKQSVAYVSIKKVQTMLDCAGPHDNRIRGMLNHHGATTGRSTNSLVQFQNMKRPAGHLAQETYKGSKRSWSEEAYKAICEGISREELELCFGPVLEVISSCIRHFVHNV